MMDLACETPGQGVTFAQVVDKAGCERRAARGDLAAMTKLIRKQFKRDNWPLRVTQTADGIAYQATPRSLRLGSGVRFRRRSDEHAISRAKSGANRRDENGGEQDGETESIGGSEKGLGDATYKRPEAPRRSGKSLGCSSEEMQRRPSLRRDPEIESKSGSHSPCARSRTHWSRPPRVVAGFDPVEISGRFSPVHRGPDGLRQRPPFVDPAQVETPP